MGRSPYIIIVTADNTSTTQFAFVFFRYDARKFPASELFKLISAIQSTIQLEASSVSLGIATKNQI